MKRIILVLVLLSIASPALSASDYCKNSIEMNLLDAFALNLYQFRYERAVIEYVGVYADIGLSSADQSDIFLADDNPPDDLTWGWSVLGLGAKYYPFGGGQGLALQGRFEFGTVKIERDSTDDWGELNYAIPSIQLGYKFVVIKHINIGVSGGIGYAMVSTKRWFDDDSFVGPASDSAPLPKLEIMVGGTF